MIQGELKHKLDRFIRKYYLNKLLRGSIYFIGFGLVYFLIISLFEYFGHFNQQIRLALLLALIVGLGINLVFNVFIPLAGIFRIGRHLSYEEAGKLIGRFFPEIDDKIINTLDLGKLSEGESSLVKASIEQKIQAFRPLVFSNAVNLRESLKYWPVLVVPILIFAFVALSGNWNLISESSTRIVSFNKDFIREAPFKFRVLNKELLAEEGENFTLELGFEGDLIPESAEILAEAFKGRMTRNEKDIFSYSIEGIRENIKFRFLANGYSSKEYEIEVLPVPRIKSYLIEVIPPKYTRNPPFLESKSIFDIPEGSKLRWYLKTLSANKAQILTKDTAYNFQDVGDGLFSFEKVLLESLEYSIVSENEFLKKESGSNNRINIIKDKFPELAVKVDIDSLIDNLVYYSAFIGDDYGFSKMDVLLKSGGKELMRINIPISSPENTAQEISGFLDLNELATDQSKLSLNFRLWDNDEVNGAKLTTSKSFDIRLLNEAERKQEVEEQYESYFSKKEELNKANQELLKELERLRQKLLNQKKSSWKDKERIEQLLDKQKEIEQKRKELNKQREELEKKDKEPKNKNDQLKKKEEQIDKLKEDPKQKELEKLLEEVSQLMDKFDMEKLTEKMKEIEQKSKENQRKEDRLDELLKNLKFQKDVLKEVEKLEELAQKLDELSKENNEDGKEKEEQEKVEEKFEEVKKEIDKLEEENPEFKKENEEQNLEKTEDEVEEEMKKSEEQMENSEQKKANESQKKSSEKMQEMSQQMMQSMMQMQGEKREEDMKTLRQILENLEILSFDVEYLSELSKISQKSDPLYRKLLKDQKRLIDGAKIIEDSLVALGERVPEIQEVVYKELEAINENLESSIGHLQEQQGGQSAAKQQFAMTAANNLAVLLDKALRNMQQAAASESQGNQTCQKPGSGKPSPSNMKKLQGELGEKMSKMMKGKQKGEGDPGKSEGRNGKEIVEMLSRQEQIRGQLEEYLKNQEEAGEGGNGDMAKAIEEMKKIEEDLLNNKLTLESLERVKEIESKLLEFEKSELEREQDEKRESKSSDDLDQLYQKEREEYLKEKLKEYENIIYAPLNLNQYYKQQSNQYLKRL